MTSVLLPDQLYDEDAEQSDWISEYRRELRRIRDNLRVIEELKRRLPQHSAADRSSATIDSNYVPRLSAVNGSAAGSSAIKPSTTSSAVGVAAGVTKSAVKGASKCDTRSASKCDTCACGAVTSGASVSPVNGGSKQLKSVKGVSSVSRRILSRHSASLSSLQGGAGGGRHERSASYQRLRVLSTPSRHPTSHRRSLVRRASSTSSSDASSSNEAVHLQQRLKSLSTELVTLRNRLHVSEAGHAQPPVQQGSHNQQQPQQQQQQQPQSRTHGGHGHSGVVSGAGAPCPGAPGATVMGSQDQGLPQSDQPQQQGLAPGSAPCHNSQGGNEAKHALQGNVNAAYTHDGVKVSKAGGTGGVHFLKATACTEVRDLIHLPGPLTEDAVLRTLHARFFSREYFTNVGPVLVSVNAYQDVGNPLTLRSAHASARCPQLLQVVQEAARQQAETGYPQAIILSGENGSGKTYASMLLLRQLFDVAGGGSETDAFKHLAAAFTVLRSLGSAKTAANAQSSRIGHFIEVQVTDGALYRTKIHCYFLDQTRVVRPLPNEKNYHIFYQMLAGLNQEERGKLHLDGYSVQNLRYLNRGDVAQNEAQDATRFEAWKSCLSVLGIPFLDVVRVLAAVLLLGNVQFVDRGGGASEVDLKGGSEIKSVAALLGVSSVALFQGLAARTRTVRGQLVKSASDAGLASQVRDALAKALYCRTVATIVRRANSLKRMGSTSGTLSSDSNESVHNHTDTGSQHASTIGSSGAKSSKSMTVLNSAVRHATDGFIGILDMFGFEDVKLSQLEHLCINLCAETMQHFYNTHVFKSSMEACREEGVLSDLEIEYADNVPCIDLISSLRTGLLSMVDVECSLRGTPESYVQKVRLQHKTSPRFFEAKSAEGRAFGIRHYAGNVTYEASGFLETNRDVVPDDVVAVFHKTSCSFGFATHLFGSELKALFADGIAPRGVSFRVSPTAHTELQSGDEPVSTLTQDFHTRLDNLLRTLVHAKPHFVRCIKANKHEQPGHFERTVVMKQLRALQVLETVNLMAGGLPHRMRFKAFNVRYRCLAPFNTLKRTEDKAVGDCKLILEYFSQAIENVKLSNAAVNWALGKRHIFLSENGRQQLEMLREGRRHAAAVLIQAVWRGWHQRLRWPSLRRSLQLHGRTRVASMRSQALLSPAAAAGAQAAGRPRPQPISGTPPPEMERCDTKTIQQTCSLFGLDLERPPPVPPSRPYTVSGNTKLGYPQTRVMKMNYPEAAGETKLPKSETVMVVGASPRRGHLLVEYKGQTHHVPYQFLELKSSSPGTTPVGTPNAAGTGINI
ncbi:unconventional myosin-VIIa [Ixodes scapularis]